MECSVLYPFQLTSVRQLDEIARLCERSGYARLWLTQSFGIDAWSAVAAVAAGCPDLAFGMAVTLMPLFHPLEMATRLRAMAELLPGRFTVGFGVSEESVVRDVLGGRFPDSALDYTREYVRIVRTCLTSSPTALYGRYFSCVTNDLGQDADRVDDLPAVLLAALGPKMAGLAGAAADGCVTWLVPPDLLATSIVPAYDETADESGGGRGITALVPCVPLTSRADVRSVAERMLADHLRRPHYRRMLTRLTETDLSTTDLVDFAVDHVVAWGTGDDIQERLHAYHAAGAREVAVAAYGGPSVPRGMFRHTVDLVAAAAARR
jgi:alkanesulfonate monooxygenase SsuD/methylene tetrahydromethanopterin reductase-like flavin-dependent oxidoreductase (luciferase family)